MTPPDSQQTPNRSPFARRLNRAARAVILLGLLASSLPLLGASLPPHARPYHLDLLSHFAPHALAPISLLLLLSLLLRSRRLAIACAASLTLSLLVVAIAYRPLAAGRAAPGDQTIRVVHFNALNVASSWDDAFIAWLLEQDADLVALVDAPPGILERNEALQTRYPHRVAPKRGWEWPIILLSKHPIRAVSLGPTTTETRTSFVARRSVVVTLPNRAEVLFTAMHPYSPRSERAWNRALEIVKRDAPLLRDAQQRSNTPVIVAGDFNSTPTGKIFRTFARAAALRASPTLPIGTWPASRPRLLGVAIDHVFTSPDIAHIARRVGPSFRSDHRPIVVDLAVPAPTSPAQSPPPKSPPPPPEVSPSSPD